MEQTPEQAALAEQAQRNAAFERARRKLTTARDTEEQRRRTLDGLFLFRAILGGLFVALFGVGVPVFGAMSDPAVLDFTTGTITAAQLEWLAAPLVIVTLIVFLAWRRHRRSPVERALRLFYDRASQDDKRLRFLSDMVVASDLDEAPRRHPTSPLAAEAPRQISSPDALDRYWQSIVSPSSGIKRELSVERVQMTPLDPGLTLATARLHVKSRSGISRKLTTWTAIFVGPLALVFTDHLGRWTSAAIAVSCACVALAFFKFISPTDERITVSKLLIRCGKQWRLFSGEWEAHEEADLSWLDTPVPTRTLPGGRT